MIPRQFRKRRLFKRTFSSVILLNLASLFMLTWFETVTFRKFFFEQTSNHLESNALVLEHQLRPLLQTKNYHQINKLCEELRFKNRITVILPDGKVVGDSLHDPASMDPHNLREEIVNALNQGSGRSVRHSQTIGKRMMYFALAIHQGKDLLGFVRISRPLDAIDQAMHSIQLKAAAAWIIMSLLASAIILNFSRRTSQTFESLKSSAERLAAGQFEGSLPVPMWEEIGGFARAMNQMASRLDERSLTIYKQQMEVDAILASMDEGVMAVDSDAMILKLNTAMADLFEVESDRCRGRKVQEVIRNIELNQFVTKALNAGKEGVEADLTLYHPGTRHILARGTRLRDRGGMAVGAVIVLNDITQIRRLENIRREFVANVSHELRTPITSIKGFVETLQSGALEDIEDAKRFLIIISRQTERLSRIIEDLLSLSRIEQGQETIKTGLESCFIFDVVKRAVGDCTSVAESRNIEIRLSCDRSLRSRIHPSLFEQAVFNLLENAVKYSGEGSLVHVRVIIRADKMLVEVSDQGTGIPSEHLPRLFERFYRVDKARGRDIGGTGLGLSIVKHIVLAHDGKVSVESEVGAGSTFIMTLPYQPDHHQSQPDDEIDG